MSKEETKNQIIKDLVAAVQDLYYNASQRPQPDVFSLVQRAAKALES